MEAEGEAGNDCSEEGEEGQGQPGRGDVVPIEKKSGDHGAEHSEKPKTGEKIGGGYLGKSQEGQDDERKSEVPEKFKAGPAFCFEKSGAGGSDESDDEASAEPGDHPAGVGFERVVIEVAAKGERPEGHPDKGGEESEWEKEPEGLRAEAIESRVHASGSGWLLYFA